MTLRFRGDRKQAGLTDLVVRKGRSQRKTERKLHLAARKLSGSRLRRWTESSIPEGLYLMWEGYLECHGGSCGDYGVAEVPLHQLLLCVTTASRPEGSPVSSSQILPQQPFLPLPAQARPDSEACCKTPRSFWTPGPHRPPGSPRTSWRYSGPRSALCSP